MITIKNVKTLLDKIEDFTIPSVAEHIIDAKSKLLLLPGLIDPHISFGPINCEQWEQEVSTAIQSGITTAIEIPAPSENQTNLEQKRKAIDEKLTELQLPLQYFLYASANSNEIESLGLFKKLIKAIVINVDRNKTQLFDKWDTIFQMAAWEDLPIIINSTNEKPTSEKKLIDQETVLENAIHYAEKQNTRLYVFDVATQTQINIIENARKKSLLIYAETTPHYLFGENKNETESLWEAINSSVIETIGSGNFARDLNVSKHHLNLDSVTFFLPLLLNAYHEKRISLEKIVHITRTNICDILNIEKKLKDVILVDLEKVKSVQAYNQNELINIKLKGWPIYTIVQGQVFSCLKREHLFPDTLS